MHLIGSSERENKDNGKEKMCIIIIVENYPDSIKKSSDYRSIGNIRKYKETKKSRKEM